MLNYFLMVYSLELMTCKVACYKMLVYICDIEVTTNTYYQPQRKGHESRDAKFLLKMPQLKKNLLFLNLFLTKEYLYIDRPFSEIKSLLKVDLSLLSQTLIKRKIPDPGIS